MDKQTTQLCWNINDQLFIESVVVEMIVTDQNEVIACSLLQRDIGQKAPYFGFPANPKMSSVFLYHYLHWTGTELNGTERNRTDWN
jgi:hypothetical protein